MGTLKYHVLILLGLLAMTSFATITNNMTDLEKPLTNETNDDGGGGDGANRTQVLREKWIRKLNLTSESPNTDMMDDDPELDKDPALVEVSCIVGSICELKSNHWNGSDFENSTLSFTALHGSHLWMYETDNNTISGVPRYVGRFYYIIGAQRSSGESKEYPFVVNVTEITIPNHKFLILLALPTPFYFTEFPEYVGQFLKDVARAINASYSELAVKKIKAFRNTTLIMFYNTTIASRRCLNHEVDAMTAKMVDKNEVPNPEFVKAMGPRYSIRHVSLGLIKSCHDSLETSLSTTPEVSTSTEVPSTTSPSTGFSHSTFVDFVILVAVIAFIVVAFECWKFCYRCGKPINRQVMRMSQLVDHSILEIDNPAFAMSQNEQALTTDNGELPTMENTTA
ncbi:hypothetical protein L5515_016347 [Caenorhabditis briggsae]|uniref:Peptidase S72 domain-containing protein n=1 Tax=Caenorhabditis briggsae TaxID=6238 RepID=A0AAE9FCK8_CAEBR|nr:hypothetical protein L5515_016347 [Caenorhabditis briggsae]